MTRAHGNYHQRRIRYIDETIQKWLLVWLVLLEIGLVGVLAWLMYRHLNQIIDDNLYRVHLIAAAPLLIQLWHAAMPLLGIFLLGNALVLLFAYLVWRQYLNTMLRQFLMLVGKTHHLDFSHDRKPAPYRYELLMLTETQRTKERQRLTAIREGMSKLKVEISETGNIEAIREALNNLEAALPPST